jgi:hypothetical protein
MGTGFLVRRTKILTNRHVLEKLRERKQELGLPEAQDSLPFA